MKTQRVEFIVRLLRCDIYAKFYVFGAAISRR